MLNPLILLALASAALADIDVQVGLNGELRFSPETVSGQPGELVNFHFHTSTHSATESTSRLKDPCHPLGGFDTGIQPDGAVKSIVISTHNSIYVHCTPHCGQGMVMIVNPGPNDSVETFRKAAIAQEGGVESTTSTAPSKTTTPKTNPTTSSKSSESEASNSSSSTEYATTSSPLATGSTPTGSSAPGNSTSTAPSSTVAQSTGTTGGAAATSSGATTELEVNGFTSLALFLTSLFAFVF